MRKLYFLLLALAPFAVRSQKCPDADSIITSRIVSYPGPPGIWPYPITWNPGLVWVTTSYVPSIPPVNQDPKCGKKTWYKGGKCSIIYPDKEDSVLLATGQYLNGKKTGNWTWYHESGNKMSEGKYVNGLKTGPWKEWGDNYVNISIGNYSAGRKEGKWLEYSIPMQDENGERVLSSSVNYHLGLYNGGHTNYRENGDMYHKSTYKMGLQHGYSYDYHENGKLSHISYAVNGKTTGKNISYNEEGKITTVTNYVNGMRHGTSITHDDDHEGKTIENYYRDQLSGWKKVYRYNELREKTWYAKGRKNGLEFLTYENQKIFAHYKDDVLHGSYKTYIKDDSIWILNQACRYKNAEMDSINYQYNSGYPFSTSYRNGKRHGVETQLNPEGDTIKYCEYKNDTLNGHYKTNQNSISTHAFYKMGKPIYEKTYANDKLEKDLRYRHGVSFDVRFTDTLNDGSLVERYYYPNGTTPLYEKIFSSENKNPKRITYRSYHENGHLNNERTTDDGVVAGKHIQFNLAGDTIYYETYQNNKKNGYSVHRDNQIVQRGGYTEDIMTGEWRYYYALGAKGKPYHWDSLRLAGQGEMYKGEPFGTWTYYYNNGQLMYSGCICGNPQYIYSTWTSSSYGTNYYPAEYPTYHPQSPPQPTPPSVGFPTGQHCGNYTMYYPDGTLYMYKNKDTTIEYFSNGDLYRHAIGHQYIQLDTSGNIYSARWKDTVVDTQISGDGKTVTRENKKNKTIQTTNSQNRLTSYERFELYSNNRNTHVKRTWDYKGMLLSWDSSGICFRYFPNGDLQIAECPDSSVWYHDNRKLKTYFVKGKNDNWYRHYYDNGQVRNEYICINKRPEGWCKSYYSDGSLAHTSFFKNGNEEGDHLEYFQNGKMKEKRQYKNGVMNGEYTKWNEQGEIILEEHYKEGVKETNVK
ncbi:MAG: hypothetical protein ACHQF2_00230 [Flavobacteriales bacterium]